MSGKVHSEHILATKVLMPVKGGGVGCSGKCTMSTFLLPARGMQSIFELPSCFLNVFWRHMSYFGTTDIPVLDLKSFHVR